MEKKIALFEEKQIRKTWRDEKWYFSIVDVIYALTDSLDPKQYLKKLKQRDYELQNNWGTICTPLRMKAKDGKIREIQMSDTEGILRIIQSIPSPKAEPFKRWLARVGRERIEEINDPELSLIRMRETYIKKGYSPSWIEQREKSIITRNNLTDEWKNRGAKTKKDYALLTNEIYKEGFGLRAKEYKQMKKIHESQNLRDSMTNIELALTNLGEIAAVEFHKNNESMGLKKLKEDVNDAGKVIKISRTAIENKLNKSVITASNHLNLTDKK